MARNDLNKKEQDNNSDLGYFRSIRQGNLQLSFSSEANFRDDTVIPGLNKAAVLRELV